MCDISARKNPPGIKYLRRISEAEGRRRRKGSYRRGTERLWVTRYAHARRAVHARVGANIVNKSRILYTPSRNNEAEAHIAEEERETERERGRERGSQKRVGGQRCSAFAYSGHLFRLEKTRGSETCN